MTFCELREKDVINIRDCRRLGHVCDLELDPKNGCILALTASSGEETLKLWREEHPDLIILDVMMPRTDGFTVLKEIRRTSRVPVLMLTARGEAEDRFTGFENGADDYLIKPFLPKELLNERIWKGQDNPAEQKLVERVKQLWKGRYGE